MLLNYIISGKANKETILFVHGAGANASQFEPQHEYFSNRYQVVSISLRGHGLSPLPSPNSTPLYSLEENAHDVMETIQNLNLSKIHYVGNSAGGVIGLIVVSRFPSNFLSLTTFGTTAQMDLPRFTAPLVKYFDYFMIRFFKEKYLQFAANQTGIHKDSRRAIYQMFLQATGAVPHLRFHLANYNFLSEIENLSVPYTLIQCEHDKEINRTLKTTITAISKNSMARVIAFQGAGHIANLDDPDGFNRLLENVLSEVSSAKA